MESRAPEQPSGIARERLRQIYVQALRMRLCLDEKIDMKLKGQHEIGGFYIGGMGEEVHGYATAHAVWDTMGLPVGQPAADRLAIFGHYRSDALVDGVLRLSGYDDFVLDQLRQQAARATCPNAGGRQMVMHVSMVDYGIQPNQSALGMQLGKAAGYAMGWRLKGVERGALAVAVLGDGTMGCSDFHEALSAAGLWDLPVLFVITDNSIAISTPPSHGRPIVDVRSFVRGYGISYFAADDESFSATYDAVAAGAGHVLRSGTPAVVYSKVTRFRGHSSSNLKDFDPEALDPVVELGRWLVDEGLITEDEALRPRSPWPNSRTRYLANYEENPLADGIRAELRAMRDSVFSEPKPSPESIFEFAMAPLPQVSEPLSPWDGPKSELTMAQAIRAALDSILEGGKAAIWGEDVGATLGGVFGCTRFLPEKYPGRVLNTPINEPLIAGTAVGAALHGDLAILPEIQFADYSLNTLHWLFHAAHLRWATRGQVSPNVTFRMPSDPTLTGAIYHSMSVESYYAHLPSVVICMPTCAFDAYGLLRTAAMHRGPVIFLEPKDLYRVRHDPARPTPDALLQAGPRLPGEVPCGDEDGIPTVRPFEVPFGKARHVLEGGDCTVVAWGVAFHKAVVAARALAARAPSASEPARVRVDLFDLRTLVPYDREAISRSVARTGRLVVATEDRAFSSLARQIQADMAEAHPGLVSRIASMEEVPSPGMAPTLFRATVLSPEKVVGAVDATMRQPQGRPSAALLDNELHWLQYAPSFHRR